MELTGLRPHAWPAFRIAAGALVLTFAACEEQSPPPPPAQLGNYERPPALKSAPARKVAAAPKPRTATRHRSAHDKALAARVKEALRAREIAKAEEIEVDALDGVVTLLGTSETKEARDMVAEVASLVEGVETVENRIILAGDAR